MPWNHHSFYKALQARDPRFDGIFFVGVKSTGIFCRPICPARTPLEKNCSFYSSQAHAAAAGFRPCLRCRPERAPGLSPIEALPRLAHLAAARLQENPSISLVADDLGVSERQLRRAFHREFGVAPSVYRNYQRLETARLLLENSELSITDIAHSSGFQSVRRFNSAFKQQLKLPPNRLRSGKPSRGTAKIPISFRPPLPWETILEFLRERVWKGIEEIHGESYSRNVQLGEHRGTITVRPKNETTLELCLPTSLLGVLPKILMRIRSLFDLDCNPQEVFNHLQPYFPDFPLGLRVPGAFDSFELAVRAILGQQVSVKAASTLAARLVDGFGDPLEQAVGTLTHYFPSAQSLGQVELEKLASIGLPIQRAKSIQVLARAAANSPSLLAAGTDLEEQMSALLSLPGIGPWTAHYIAMRALRWPDAFPNGDLGLKKALRENKASIVLEKSQAWRPWRSYAAIHLWSTL